MALQLLRVVQFMGTAAWYTDSMYALGIMLHGHAAATELELATQARKEVRLAKKEWPFTGVHTPPHIGFPPNACADAIAQMGGPPCIPALQSDGPAAYDYRTHTKQCSWIYSFSVGACPQVDGIGRNA